jgi:hypothetical protein
VSFLCLVVGGAVAATLSLPGDVFELSWTHSIEKVEWRERWRVEDGTLSPVQAWISGSGPGMEPPEGGRWEGGRWTYRPQVPPQRSVTLANSSNTADYRICTAEGCQALAPLVGGFDRPVALEACR